MQRSLKKSWITKHVTEMVKNGLINKGEEAEIHDMLDIVAMNNRKLAWHFFETFERECDERAEAFLRAINGVTV